MSAPCLPPDDALFLNASTTARAAAPTAAAAAQAAPIQKKMTMFLFVSTRQEQKKN